MVNSIDGFQGSQKDVIILSLDRSEIWKIITITDKNKKNKKYLNAEKSKTLGFLIDYRRLNVAITRAK